MAYDAIKPQIKWINQLIIDTYNHSLSAATLECYVTVLHFPPHHTKHTQGLPGLRSSGSISTRVLLLILRVLNLTKI